MFVDQYTGQSFSQWSMSARSNRPSGHTVSKWFHATRGSTKGLDGFINHHGTASLQEMAWRVVLCHLETLEVDHIKSMGWPVARQFWEMIQKK
jgi:hypothetical protein